MSLILFISSYKKDLLTPASIAAFEIATSVASPTKHSLPWIRSSVVSVHIVPSSKINFLSLLLALPKQFLTSVTVILFCVKVPVLSEQITLLLPSVSTAGSLRIILFFLAIFVTPIESIIVTIAGSPSGIAATARPTDVINISIIGIFLKIPITNINTQIIIQAIAKIFPTSASFF